MAETESKLFAPEWFPYYFERFEGSDRVALMSLAEEGAYHRAIRLAWKYGSVPSDPALLAARIQKRCTPVIAKTVLTMFEVMPGVPSRAIHPTVEQIRTEQEEKHLTKVRGGLASAAKRGKQEGSNTTPAEPSSVQAQPLQIKIQNQILDLDSEFDFKRLILRVREDFPNADERLVEVGVIHTIVQRNGSTEPIRSWKYFRPEVQKILDEAKSLSAKTVEAMLQQRRKQFRAAHEKAA